MNWQDASHRVLKSYRDWLRAVRARRESVHKELGLGLETDLRE